MSIAVTTRVKIAPKFSNATPTRGNFLLNENTGSFHEAIKFPILLGQILCLIPISENEFTWFSFPILISALMICCQIVMAVLSLFWLNRSGVSIFKSGKNCKIISISCSFFFKNVVLTFFQWGSHITCIDCRRVWHTPLSFGRCKSFKSSQKFGSFKENVAIENFNFFNFC